MKPKNVFSGTSNLFLGGLLAYTLSSDLNAQSFPSQVMDSTVVEKEILSDMQIYDDDSNEGVADVP